MSERSLPTLGEYNRTSINTQAGKVPEKIINLPAGYLVPVTIINRADVDGPVLVLEMENYNTPVEVRRYDVVTVLFGVYLNISLRDKSAQGPNWVSYYIEIGQPIKFYIFHHKICF